MLQGVCASLLLSLLLAGYLLSCCRFFICCWLSTKAALRGFLILCHHDACVNRRRLSTGSVDVAGGESATLGGLHVEAAGADGFAGLELSSFQDDLDGGSIWYGESVMRSAMLRSMRYLLGGDLLGLPALRHLLLDILVLGLLGSIIDALLYASIGVEVIKVRSDLAGRWSPPLTLRSGLACELRGVEESDLCE